MIYLCLLAVGFTKDPSPSMCNLKEDSLKVACSTASAYLWEHFTAVRKQLPISLVLFDNGFAGLPVCWLNYSANKT